MQCNAGMLSLKTLSCLKTVLRQVLVSSSWSFSFFWRNWKYSLKASQSRSLIASPTLQASSGHHHQYNWFYRSHLGEIWHCNQRAYEQPNNVYAAKEHRVLNSVFCRLLCVPATSATVERVFPRRPHHEAKSCQNVRCPARSANAPAL